MPDNTFDCFCIVELFGHSRIAGRVTEQVIGGQGFVRVDVPALPKDRYNEETPSFTRFFGPGAIYSITPVDEETVIRAAQSMRVAPVNVYLAAPQLAAKIDPEFDPNFDGGDDPGDEDEEEDWELH